MPRHYELNAQEFALVEAYRNLPDDWREETGHFLEHNEPALAIELWVLALLDSCTWFRDMTCLARIKPVTDARDLNDAA